ncbi:MAG: recombination protein RecR [Clostridiales bacterium]|nr:recombination protein RecR [Clostridiales bacterium]
MEYILPVQRLIEKFASLRGVGRKTAARYAFSVLDMPEEEAIEFANAIIAAKKEVMPCSVCGNLSDKPVCDICGDDRRDKSVICVVEDPRAIIAFEKTREYRGLYHVLGGVISPTKGIGPDKLRIAELMERLEGGEVKELIIATNPNVDGETTALYLARMAAGKGIKTTRLAYGVPVGADIEYADEVTLMRAMDGRREIK